MRSHFGTRAVIAVITLMIAAAPCAMSNPGPSRVSGPPRMLSEWEIRRGLRNRSYLLGLATERQLSVLDGSHLPLLEEVLEEGPYLPYLSACIALRWIGGAEAEVVLEKAARDSNSSRLDRGLAERFLDDLRNARDGVPWDDSLESAASLDEHDYWVAWDPISDVHSCTGPLALGRDGRLLFRFLLDDVQAIRIVDEDLSVVHTVDAWEHRWICDQLQGQELLERDFPPDYTLEKALGLRSSGAPNLLVIELPRDGRVVFEVAGDCLRYLPPVGAPRSLGSDDVVVRSEALGGYVSVTAALGRKHRENGPGAAADRVAVAGSGR